MKSIGGKRKEELAPIIQPQPAEPPLEKPLQTTNQVKANLISANMIKGDMILTKPGQSRNQKVYFIQKKIVVKTNEIRNLELKKTPVVITKTPSKLPNQLQTKLATTEDGKLITVTTKTIPLIQAPPPLVPVEPPPHIAPVVPEVIPPLKVIAPSGPVKIKPVAEVKKEKREKCDKFEKFEKPAEVCKTPDIKTPEPCKKHVKKETKKSPAVFEEALGPALFSTPDIIRRVGSVGEAKAPDHEALEASLESLTTGLDSTHMLPVKSDLLSLNVDVKPQDDLLAGHSDVSGQVNEDTSGLMETEDHDQKIDHKEPTADDLNAVLEPGE